jgi:hypothetical protein
MGAIAILHARRSHAHGQQHPKGVDEERARSPPDLLAGVIAVLANLWRTSRRLRIEHGCRWLIATPFALTPCRS